MCAQIACILDVTSFKPGNVFLLTGFRGAYPGGTERRERPTREVHLLTVLRDMTATDLLLSAAAIGPVLDRAPLRRVGETILDCIRETRRVTKTNTNLGIVLLLAPLASVQPHLDLRGGLIRTLMRLNGADARA